MRIIGIDPGTTIIGFGIIETSKQTCKLLDYGCIRTKPNAPLEIKLSEIAMDLTKIIKLWKPKKAAIERLFFTKNVKTAISVAHARGVILETLHSKGVEITEYTPQQIKSNICGYGKAGKENVQKMVQIIFGLKNPPKPDDAADAIAAAFSLANSLKLTEIKC
ncbi:MAG: crossover junction endodeoxyribonuclease RuvC, crossover junction endodeoxyribonuclease RuvC [Candidatus Peregrinibacteria bacterium GW2011_GWC2_39_14]|nr:MAG: crossover junction endodeoxyribonuclease RuvC, crossover junction endodeoxyribonuclease RuvC [Candidatus Peregrinibacteria bacterium GW2011_GWC2_39_14]